MQIPNSIIHIRTENGIGYGPLIVPAYEAKVLRKVYAGRLATENGLTVEAYPANGNSDTRYTESDSTMSVMATLRQKYKGDGRGYFVDQVFDIDTLESEINTMLFKEAERLERESKPVEIVAHKSFIDFGLTKDQAIALQNAGYATRADCVGKSLGVLNNVPSIDLAVAKRLATEDTPKK